MNLRYATEIRRSEYQGRLASEAEVILRDKVQKAYSAAAERPYDAHDFPMGRAFAEGLGYPQELLASLPDILVEAFTGVSNVSVFSNLPIGATVLDLGCGAGMDSIIAARRVGRAGRVLGIDFSHAMLTRARRAAIEDATTNVNFCQANAEELPIRDSFVEIALVNGIFNLNRGRDAIFRELHRVIHPGGSVYVAELILSKPVPPDVRASESDWFA